MKKTLLFIGMLCIATLVNAQIELEKEFNLDFRSYAQGCYLISNNIGDALFFQGNDTIYIYNADYTLYKSVYLPERYNVNIVTRNVFTTDGKISFVCDEIVGTHPENKSIITIINEDGEVIKDLELKGVAEGNYGLILIDGEIKFYVSVFLKPNSTHNPTSEYKYITSFYSVPGNGEPFTDLVSSPAMTPRARKSINKGFVQVYTEDHIYTVNGQTLK